jgi:hypothetical protein
MAKTTDIRRLVSELKLEKGCELCGYKQNAASLSFDHLNPSEKYRTASNRLINPSDLIKGKNRYGLETVMSELAKCRILCSNCHMAQTYPHFDRDLYLTPIKE